MSRHLPGFGKRLPAEIREEIRFYLEERTRELVAQGMSEEEAWRAAVVAFGDVEKIEAEVEAIELANGRSGMGMERWTSWARDLKYAVRSLRKRICLILRGNRVGGRKHGQDLSSGQSRQW